ncbi:MAG: NAD(P)H-dependent oxidoreductase [Sulfurospirillaceae bacterium]|nr:NAD(P)H-dependent oxidoreductase [Sulfurospirillaceae bacterium]
MKKVLVIAAHPQLDNGSLANKIICDELSSVEGIEIRKIAQMYPDFKIDVAAEQKALLGADIVIFQFPFYWYSVPGILKEWIDQVFSYGFAYGTGGDKLKGKEFVLSVTIGGPKEAYSKEGYNHFSIEELLKPLEQTSLLTGMKFNETIRTHSMIFIEGVYNVKEEVVQRAKNHALEVKHFIASKSS